MLESQFQAKLIKELKKLFPGCIVMKSDSGYLQGIPDLLILFNDKWAALECKQYAGCKKATKPRILCGQDGRDVLFQIYLPREQGGSAA